MTDTKQSNTQSDDEALARSLQLVADMEYAEQKAFRTEYPRSRRRGHVPNIHSRKNSKVAPSPTDTDTENAAASHFPADFSSRGAGRNARSRDAIFTDGSRGTTRNDALLFVPCCVNDRIVEMMVDTGAQSSVISAPLMKTLGLEKFLNKRKTGIAAGVGTAPIIGRIENCLVKIGQVEFLLFFSVLEMEGDMFILGIDQMRRFNCLIDLQSNKLIFGGRDGLEVDCFGVE